MKITFDVSLQVEAINLESLELCWACLGKINLSSCKAIRNLSLSYCEWDTTTQSSFEDLISNLPLLEDLIFDNSYNYNSGLKHLRISNQHLKSIKLLNVNSENDMIKLITIKSVPKLVSFCCEGNINCNISIESPNILNGKFVIRDIHHNYNLR
uniref:Uncharacterized protein n=1 Tax=Cannabis sativa TaxID=3483 RepID=A0A803QUT3_CANSA